MLEFISQNNNLTGIVIISITGLYAFVKWVDSRNRGLKEKRYDTYMKLIGIISGNRSDSTTPRITEQIAATWFLLEYKEYYYMTKKIFLESDLENIANEPWTRHVLPHIKRLLKEIS